MTRNMAPEEMTDVCLVECIHDDILNAVVPRMPAGEDLGQLAELFKLFGDKTKLGILWALSESEMCVCDLCALLRMKQPAVSHQLKNLRLARLVKSRRQGKMVFYRLDDMHVADLLRQGMAHVQEA